MQSQLAFCRSTPWKLALQQSLKQPVGALDDEDRATANLYFQNAAQAAEEAWQQTSGGLQGPIVTNPTVAALEHPVPLLRMKTVRTRTSQRLRRADPVRRSSKRSFHG